jgi:hypothetical protein
MCEPVYTVVTCNVRTTFYPKKAIGKVLKSGDTDISPPPQSLLIIAGGSTVTVETSTALHLSAPAISCEVFQYGHEKCTSAQL